MKKLNCSRKQILCIIQATCIALFLAASSGYAGAAPIAGPGFTVNGSTITGSGSHTGTEFYSTGSGAYTVTIQPGASLNNTGSAYTNLIQFNNGTTTNSGALYGLNTANVSSAIYIGNQTAITGVGGSVNTSVANTSSGYIVGSHSGVYVYNNFSGGTSTGGIINVSNAGTIKSTDTTSGYAVGLFTDNTSTTGNVVNSISATNASTGTLSGSYVGLELYNYTDAINGTAANSLSVSNAGIITGTEYGVYGYNEDYDDSTANTSINESITLTNSGNITAGYDGLYLFNETEYDYYTANTNMAISVTNSGYIGGGTYGVYLANYPYYYTGYNAPGANITDSMVLNNTGVLLGTSNSGAYVANSYTYYSGYYYGGGTGNIKNSVAVTNSGSIQGGEYGLYAYNESYVDYNGGQTVGAITLANSGFIGGLGGGSSVDSGAYLYNESEYDDYETSETNSITANNTGAIKGGSEGLYAYNYSYDAGYDTGAPVTNTIAITNSASGFIGGKTGYGIYAENDDEYSSGGSSSPAPVTNSISVANSGQIIGQQGDALYANNFIISVYGASSNTTAISNSGSILSYGGDGLDLLNSISSSTGSGTSTISVFNSSTGSIYGTNSGIYVSNIDGSGTQSSSVVNYGYINGAHYGVNFSTPNSSLLTVGGMISGGTDAINLGGGNSAVTIQARSNIQGTIQGNNQAGNALTFNLILSPSKAAALNTEIAAAGSGPGTFTDPSGDVYNWDGFSGSTVHVNAVSLESSVDSGLVGVATAIDNNGLPVNTGPGSVGAYYDQFLIAAYGNPEATLNQLVGREINQGIDTLGLSLNTTLASDLNQHLDNLLTGSQIGGIDVSGLHISDAGSMYAMGDTSQQLDSLLPMVGTSALGGTEMSTDGKTMVPVPAQPNWGVWASGNVTLGNESATSTLSAFHSTLGSPTVGVDYRITPDLVLGLLGSYTTGDADFDSGSKINVNTGMFALYGTWRDGNWHVNGLAGGGPSEYKDSRTTFGGLTAGSNPSGDDILTDWTGGYDFHLGDRWTVTPEVGLQYTHLDIDSYTETGAGPFDLNLGSQDIDSLRSHVGFKVDKAYSLGKDLTFIPELRAMWYHEYLDDSRGVSTSLPGAPALGSFSVSTSSPQRDFALVGVGLNTAFTGYKGMPIGMFVNYNAQVGQSNFIANSVNAGVRFDF